MKLNWANRITIIRILLIVPFVSCMLKINDQDLSQATCDLLRYIAVIIFLVMAASDMLDGHLARKHGQVTRLGSFLDPMADKLLMTCACLLLSSERAHIGLFLLPPTVVVLIIGKDLFLLMGFLVIYFITFQVRVVSVPIGKIATALQMSMVTAILIAPEVSQYIPGWIWFLRVLWWSAAVCAIFSTLIYIRNGSRYIEDHEHQLDKPKN